MFIIIIFGTYDSYVRNVSEFESVSDRLNINFSWISSIFQCEISYFFHVVNHMLNIYNIHNMSLYLTIPTLHSHVSKLIVIPIARFFDKDPHLAFGYQFVRRVSNENKSFVRLCFRRKGFASDFFI